MPWVDSVLYSSAYNMLKYFFFPTVYSNFLNLILILLQIIVGSNAAQGMNVCRHLSVLFCPV
jgi:hypothetical protein